MALKQSYGQKFFVTHSGDSTHWRWLTGGGGDGDAVAEAFPRMAEAVGEAAVKQGCWRRGSVAREKSKKKEENKKEKNKSGVLILSNACTLVVWMIGLH